MEASSPLDAGGDAHCSGPSLAKTWTAMDNAPVSSTTAALLPVVTGMSVISLSKAQAILCSGIALAPMHDGSQVQAWGESNEVQLNFDTATGDGLMLSLFQGYYGLLEFKTDPALGPQHSFKMGISQIEEDGAPVEITWTGRPSSVADAIFNALMYTYGSPLGIYTGALSMSCQALSVCPVNTSRGYAVWEIVPLGLVFTFGGLATQPEASTVSEIDLSVPE
jgi:hypothetical protein